MRGSHSTQKKDNWFMSRGAITKLTVGLFVISSVLLPVNAYAVTQGGRCDILNKKVTQDGISYVCKRGASRWIWQKLPLTEAQKGKLWTDCLVSRAGNAGFSNEDLINASNYCRSKLGFGY